MDVKSAAAALDGSEYREGGSRDLFAAMKEAGLVAVYGASDDLIEFEGAIRDERGAPGVVHITGDGLPENECEDEDCPYFQKQLESASTIEALWCPEGQDCSWAYRTKIPHQTFHVMEDGEVYCTGIVFALSDVPLFGGVA